MIHTLRNYLLPIQLCFPDINFRVHDVTKVKWVSKVSILTKNQFIIHRLWGDDIYSEFIYQGCCLNSPSFDIVVGGSFCLLILVLS